MVLGLTQGLSEFLPISSSGHLILVPWALGWNDVLADVAVKKTYDVALHMGTLLAVVGYFRSELIGLLRAGLRALWRRRMEGPEERLAFQIAVATVPAALAGFLLESFFEKVSQPWVIAVALAAFGLVMLVADRRAGERELGELTARDAALIGIAQAAALVPGVSRSGVTITAATALGAARPTAARFSFLLSVPVIAGAGMYKGVDLVRDGFPASIGPGLFAIGIAASAVSGFLAVAGLIRFLQRRSLTGFVAYRVVVAAAVLLLIALNTREASL